MQYLIVILVSQVLILRHWRLLVIHATTGKNLPPSVFCFFSTLVLILNIVTYSRLCVLSPSVYKERFHHRGRQASLSFSSASSFADSLSVLYSSLAADIESEGCTRTWFVRFRHVSLRYLVVMSVLGSLALMSLCFFPNLTNVIKPGQASLPACTSDEFQSKMTVLKFVFWLCVFSQCRIVATKSLCLFSWPTSVCAMFSQFVITCLGW